MCLVAIVAHSKMTVHPATVPSLDRVMPPRERSRAATVVCRARNFNVLDILMCRATRLDRVTTMSTSRLVSPRRVSASWHLQFLALASLTAIAAATRSRRAFPSSAKSDFRRRARAVSRPSAIARVRVVWRDGVPVTLLTESRTLLDCARSFPRR